MTEQLVGSLTKTPVLNDRTSTRYREMQVRVGEYPEKGVRSALT
jgi:hypothetical protein